MSDQLQPDRRGLSEQTPTAPLEKSSLRPLFSPPNLLADPDPMPRAARTLAFVALAAYLVSFVLPMSLGNEWFGGFAAFLLSAGFLIGSIMNWEALGNPRSWLIIASWLANPLFWKALAQMFGRQTKRFAAGGCFALGAALLASGYLFDSECSPFLGGSRNGDWFSLAITLGPAYYVWLGSFVLLAVAGFVGAAGGLKPTEDELSVADRPSLGAAPDAD